MASEKTILLTGAEQEVKLSGQNCDIRNDSADTVYISRNPNIVPDADGVVSVPVGQAAKYYSIRGSVYLLGTGKVQLCGNDYGYLVFKCAATSSGEGGEVTKTYVDNGDKTSLQLAKQFAEESFSNPNLLRNPDFKINQRGQEEYDAVGGYCVDCWGIAGDETTKDKLVIHSDHVTYQRYLNTGTCLEQVIEKPERFAGKTVTLSAFTGGSDDYSLRIRYNNTRETSAYSLIKGVSTFTITLPEDLTMLSVCLQCRTTGAEVDVYWMKLEIGSVATPFTPPDPATELAKCQRYYMRKTIVASGVYGIALAQTDSVAKIVTHLPVSMRALPSIDISVEQFELYDGVNSFPISTVVVNTFAENLLTLSVAATGLTIGKSYFMRAKSDATIAYSAEL